MEELENFFKELKECYKKEKQEFNWEWNSVESKKEITKNFVYYIAYHLSKNIIHGPLPAHLHSRMILDNKNNWSKRYVEYLEKTT